jgi:hypothetical protein
MSAGACFWEVWRNIVLPFAQSKKKDLDCLTLKMKAIHSFEMSEITNLVAQDHIPENLILMWNLYWKWLLEPHVFSKIRSLCIAINMGLLTQSNIQTALLLKCWLFVGKREIKAHAYAVWKLRRLWTYLWLIGRRLEGVDCYNLLKPVQTD